ncbi:hypothetical protein [Streptomyces cellostaticus]|uniref:hypothetical protein n=1 Tax=Streptomyces cellostaticus TaxID=67285 RepID=UPI000A4F9644|nr:hypothetical protein [Streptomyces cellostaticus]GHI03992.1 hypothetical protein Scel_23130 [Streptomyces cellostaticus]
MNTAQLDPPSHPVRSIHSKKIVSRIARIVAVSAALGIACAAGVATAAPAMAATPAPHGTAKTTAARSIPAHAHGGHDDWDDDDGDCIGLINLLCN